MRIAEALSLLYIQEYDILFKLKHASEGIVGSKMGSK